MAGREVEGDDLAREPSCGPGDDNNSVNSSSCLGDTSSINESLASYLEDQSQSLPATHHAVFQGGHLTACTPATIMLDYNIS